MISMRWIAAATIVVLVFTADSLLAAVAHADCDPGTTQTNARPCVADSSDYVQRHLQMGAATTATTDSVGPEEEARAAAAFDARWKAIEDAARAQYPMASGSMSDDDPRAAAAFDARWKAIEDAARSQPATAGGTISDSDARTAAAFDARWKAIEDAARAQYPMASGSMSDDDPRAAAAFDARWKAIEDCRTGPGNVGQRSRSRRDAARVRTGRPGLRAFAASDSALVATAGSSVWWTQMEDAYRTRSLNASGVAGGNAVPRTRGVRCLVAGNSGRPIAPGIRTRTRPPRARHPRPHRLTPGGTKFRPRIECGI